MKNGFVLVVLGCATSCWILRLGIFRTDRTARAALDDDALNPEVEIGALEGGTFSGRVRVSLNDALTSKFDRLRVNNDV